MKSPSICILMPRFEVGGLERVQMVIASGLSEAGFRPEIVTRRVDMRAHFLSKPNVPMRSLGGSRIGFFPRLFAWLHRERPDVVITTAHDIGCFVLLLRRLFACNPKIIWVRHGSLSGQIRASKGAKRVRLLLAVWLMRRSLKNAVAVIAVSRSLGEEIKRLIDPDLSIRVISNPVLSEDFEQRSRAEIEWPWQDSGLPTVIYVGRLAPVKRIDLLLEAFHKCNARLPARLLVLGEGSESHAAKKLATELRLGDSCRFLGYSDNPLPWIRYADLLVLCSDYEGFGLVLVEAMACGTQVVATDCPYGPADLLENGRYGRLVPVGDAEALAQAIEASLNSPWTSVDDLKEHAGQFGARQAIVQYVEVLNHVVGM